MVPLDGGDFTVCSRCKGACCRPDGCFLTVAEKQRIEVETGEPCRVTDHGTLLKLESVDGACQYLTETGCRLRTRPIACYLYPLYPLHGGWAMRLSCPYWREITDEEIREIIEYFERNGGEWKTR